MKEAFAFFAVHAGNPLSFPRSCCCGRDESGVPYLAIFRMILLPLAVFERYWLFDGRERKRKHSRVEAGSFAVTGSGEEYKEWLAYLATHRSLASKPDSSLQDQYEKWLLRRSKRSPLWDKA